MKGRLFDGVEKCCALCEYARKIDISGELLCARTKNLKKVSDTDVCRKFSFDILSYKPVPAKPPKFSVESISDIL